MSEKTPPVAAATATAAAVVDIKGKGHADADDDVFVLPAGSLPEAQPTQPTAPLPVESDSTGCRLVFMLRNPGFRLDYEFSTNMWSMHIGSLRTVVKFFVFNKESPFGSFEWFMREVRFTQMFGTDTSGQRKLGPALLSYHIYRSDHVELFPGDVKPASTSSKGSMAKIETDAVYGVMVMEHVNGMLDQILPLLNTKHRTRLIAEADALVGSLHVRGYAHGDLHRGNIGYRLVHRVGGPIVHAIMLYWGRCFKLDGSDYEAAAKILPYSPYGTLYRIQVTSDNIKPLEAEHWRYGIEQVAPSLTAWADKPRVMLPDITPSNDTMASAAVAYWFRQLFGWPIYGVFVERDPTYYYVAVPTQPARFMDAYGIETLDSIRERFIDHAVMTVAPVDDMFSNMAVLDKFVTDWEPNMATFRDLAITRSNMLNNTFLHVWRRAATAMWLVERGFKVDKKAPAPGKHASSSSSSGDSSGSSSSDAD
jgi:hypothetical protein